MAIQYLITAADFSTPRYKHISANITAAERIDPLILEAQKFDLQPVLGDAFYFDFAQDPTNIAKKYDLLLNGTTYQINHNGTQVDILFEGVKPALIYFTFAKILTTNNTTVTPFGIVQKKTDFSEPISDKKEGKLFSDANTSGMAYMNDVVKFLNAKKADYPLWGGCGDNNQASAGILMTSVSPNNSKKNKFSWR